MNINAALTIATGGLGNVTSQLAVVSHNVANANTAGYTRELGQQSAVTADGQGIGVRTGVAVRDVDKLLQGEAWQQSATVAAMDARAQALSAIDHVAIVEGGLIAILLQGEFGIVDTARHVADQREQGVDRFGSARRHGEGQCQECRQQPPHDPSWPIPQGQGK